MAFTALAPTWQLVAGSCVYMLAWATMALERVPVLPAIGRPACMLVSAALAVLTRAVSADEAIKSIGAQVDTLALLFSMMMIAVYVESAGLMEKFGRVLAGNSTPSAFLVKVVLASALISALLTNDVTCMFLTPIVMHECLARSLPTLPFVLAIATASNIGGACTPIGNPQNMIVQSLSKVPFSIFVGRLLLPTLVALLVDAVMLVIWLKLSMRRSARSARRPTTLGVDTSNRVTTDTVNSPSVQAVASEASRWTSNRDLPLLTRLGTLWLKRDSGMLVTIGVRSTYRHPHEIRQDLAESGLTSFPTWLLDPSHTNHQPPHLATVSLREAIRAEADALEALGNAGCPDAVAAAQDAREAILATHDEEADAAGGSPHQVHRGMPPHIAALQLEATLAKARNQRMKLEKQRSARSASCTAPTDQADLELQEGVNREEYLLMLRMCMSPARRQKAWPGLVLLVLAGMIAGFLEGLNMAWVAITSSVVLLVADGREAREIFSKVDTEVCIYFAAMFVAVAALTETGLPAKGWEVIAPAAKLSTCAGAAVTAAAVVVLSNVAGNVPVVLLLASAGFVESQDGVSAETSWLALAWLCSVAGNLTPPGSVANAIAADKARDAGGQSPSFLEYVALGIPMTVTAVAAGIPILLTL
eukprot:TRINITY_DN92431_c0_g1_i1.p1 TRINITY_DN92431_c0_g1~~TRINITY_DN92431_c0_g1_i1.p1  ORF type:complete len:647 (+),score=135.00 TRINITY_DN92431_c0_g1_i1:92-2032(+)